MKRLIVATVVLFSALLYLSHCSEALSPMTESEFPMVKDSSITLAFDSTYKFRILQLTDIHYDMSFYAPIARKQIGELITLTHPDLILLTGDIVTGQPVPFLWWHFITYLSEFRIPYAFTLGNHDSENSLSRKNLYQILMNFPYCQHDEFSDPLAVTPGDMVITINRNNDSIPGALLYLFDSNEYAPKGGYLGVLPEQTEWYLMRSNDYASRYPNAKICSLAFMHVPLTEYQEAVKAPGAILFGKRGEPEYYGVSKNGLFTAMCNREDIAGIFCGHDHRNEYLVSYRGIALSYGRSSGARNVYRSYPPGARVIDLTQDQQGFSTFIMECSGNQLYEVTIP